MGNLIAELQDEILKDKCDVVTLLRKAHRIAIKYQMTEFDKWIQNELNGYPPENDMIPSYRDVRGIVKSHNPINGWISVIIEDQKLENILTHKKIYQSVSELLKLADQQNPLYIKFPGATSQQISEMAGYPIVFESALFITKESLLGIVEKVKNELWEWTLKIEQGETNNMSTETTPKLFELIDQIPQIKKAFVINEGGAGFPRTESIYNQPIFITWKESVKIELKKLKQDDFVQETYDLFDRFSGWTDRRLFEELTAKLNAIKDNYSSYIEKAEDTATTSVDAQPAQNVTNVYFQGNISGANISTGDNANQELHNNSTERKTWMEKYGIQLLVAFITAAATIGAVFLTWWLAKG